MVADRREHERHPVQVDGKLIFADGRCVYDCVIVDVSDGGARICLAQEIEPPQKVFLWQTKTGSVLECEVCWREHKFIGLRFIDTCGRQLRRTLISACQPAPSRISRWMEKAPK